MLHRLSAFTYTMIVIFVIAGAGLYGVRRNELFACPANYVSDNYIAYCQANYYGDYDYGAFWYGLEPETHAAVADAQVLFLGNSRMQFALSTQATRDWFDSRSATYYLLGFAYNGNQAFLGPLLQRLRHRAKAYVINVDLFFEDSLPRPAAVVLRDSTALARYVRKQAWQRVHQRVCMPARLLCGQEVAFVRSRSTGAWIVDGGRFTAGDVFYEDRLDTSMVRRYAIRGRQFVNRLPVARHCVILIHIPTDTSQARTTTATAVALADSLGLSLISPRLSALRTFDRSHLDQPSAERWSGAMLDMIGPSLSRCLSDSA